MGKKNKNKLTKLEKELLKIQWRDIYIDGIQTNYEISNSGLVRNKTTNHLLHLHLDRKGYRTVSFSTPTRRVCTKKVHRLVAIAFIPNPENKSDVNHKDGNKSNNNDWNLEWMTRKENIEHAMRTGLWKKESYRFQDYVDKLIEEQILKICKLLQDGVSVSEVVKIIKANNS